MAGTKKPGSGDRPRLKSIPGGKAPSDGPSDSSVVDLGAARDQRARENRRRVERYFLDRLVEVFCEMAGRNEPYAVRLDEVSQAGCSFSLTREAADTLPKAPDGGYLPIEAKIYFSKESFVRVGFRVTSVSPELRSQGRSMRVGCELDPAFSAAEAFVQFVRFIEAYSAHCGTDVKRAGSL
jgi:hypothetical protein